ncbi:hypothetical protein [Streptomyces celluloflavus]|uniref:hypothetical protein n=1 Tax=Streptomyces celluloflavus TaxID=58344 RepID=UPI00365D9059
MGRYGAAALLLGYSAERVAELLGLHVGTVRTFVRVESVYDEERATLKIIVLGGPDTTAELLKIIRTLAEERE